MFVACRTLALRSRHTDVTLRGMIRLTLIATLALAGCAKTHPAMPGEAEGGQIVVTYYYLKF